MHLNETQNGTNHQNTLLVVDDSLVSHVLLKQIFEPSYQILDAYSGREGLQILLTNLNKICGILLDVVMPDMNGLQVLRSIKDLGLSERFPVFLITSQTDDKTLQEAYSLGVMDVISKPVVPFVVERRINSVIELFQARERLRMVVEQQQERMSEQERRLFEYNAGMIETLATAIEFRSDESGSHVQHIRDITVHVLQSTSLGENLKKSDIDLIGMAAVTHDAGKIAIPDQILNKPGRLTREEFEIMKTHTQKGAELLSHIPQMKTHEAYRYAYDIALHHHERWDGNGYPDGLKGNEISIWAQVVSVADVYDALVSKRCYKTPYGFDTAVQMIRDNQCGVFNPTLLDNFFKVEKDLRCLYSGRAASD